MYQHWKGNSLPQANVRLTTGHIANWHHSLHRSHRDGISYLHKEDYVILLCYERSGLDPRNPICLIYHYYIKRTS